MDGILGTISRSIPPGNFKSMKLVCRTARLVDARTLGEIRSCYDLFTELYRREVFTSTDFACLKMLLRAEDLHPQARQVARYEREAKETLLAALNTGAKHPMPSEIERKDCEPVQAQETAAAALLVSPTFVSSDSQQGETIPVSQPLPWSQQQQQGRTSLRPRASAAPRRSGEEQFCASCHSQPISRSALPPYSLRPAKGLVMIINMETFSGGAVRLDDRPGSGYDVQRLYNCFCNILNYTVEIKNNLSRTQLLGYLREVASRSHTDNDCLLCFLMSHGCKDSLFASDGSEVPLTSIIQFFKECRQLDHKPKLFFLQSCRSSPDATDVSSPAVQADNVQNATESGEQATSSSSSPFSIMSSESGAPMSQSSTAPSRYNLTSAQSSVTSSQSSVTSSQSSVTSSQSSMTSAQTSETSVQSSSSSDSDILIGYATSPQGSAYRANNRGSVYIEKLCNCIHNLTPRHENLTDILAEVNRKVAKEAKEEYQRVQIPMPMYTLKRRLVFPCPRCRDCKCT